MSTADSAYDAIMGTGAYADTGKIQACTIANLYVSFVHIVALDGSGINTVEDMKGKRISVGSAGSSTEGAADRILEAAGLDPRKDITRDSLGVAESVSAMKDRKLDAFFWIGGLPTGAVTDLVNTPNLKVKFIKADQYIPKLTAKYGPQYASYPLPKAVYAGLDADVPGIGIGEHPVRQRKHEPGSRVRSAENDLRQPARSAADPPRGALAEAGDSRHRLLDPVPPGRHQVLHGEGRLEAIE